MDKKPKGIYPLKFSTDTAKVSMENTLNSILKKNYEEITECLRDIKIATKNCLYEIEIRRNISRNTQIYLRSLGYNVISWSVSTTINWIPKELQNM